MFKFFAYFFSFLLLSLVFPFQTALAGGGPVSLHAFALKPFDQTHTFIVEAETYTSDSDCSSITYSVGLAETVVGDSVTPFTPPDDGTYLQRHFTDGNGIKTWLSSLCTTYTKVISGEKRQRTFTATITIHGTPFRRETKLSFGDDEISRQIQSAGRYNDYDNTPMPDVYDQTYLENDKREIKLQWNKITWATKYAIFSGEVQKNDTDPAPVFITTTENTKITVPLPAFFTLKISVTACKADDPCNTIVDNKYGYFWLNKMTSASISNQPVTIVTTQTAKLRPVSIVPSQALSPNNEIISAPSIPDDKRVEELNKKVANLEAKLNESQKQQSFLEKRVNNLLALIKRFFPFVK